MKKIAVILCGCGSLDGSEIHEATFTLSAIDENNASYQCFSMGQKQQRVLNFLTGETKKEERVQIEEAARIARGNIKLLETLSAKDFDALVIPGGFGAAFNLCSFATDGINASIEPQVKHVLQEFYAAKKPIGLICITPCLAALAFGKTLNPVITAGNLSDPTSLAYKELGCQVQECSPRDCIIDEKNKIISTPAYMNAKRISDVRLGIYKLVENVLKFA